MLDLVLTLELLLTVKIFEQFTDSSLDIVKIDDRETLIAKFDAHVNCEAMDLDLNLGSKS